MPTGDQSGKSPSSTRHLVVDLARPYRGWLVIILLAMLVETVAGLAGPWPLKVVIDNAIGGRPAPSWLFRLLGPALAGSGPALAAAAAFALVLIAAIGGIASYIDNYYTESVGQWVANDLRMKMYEHLERLSFSYYDTHRTGLLLSTITDDVGAVQDFVSSSTLSILIDLATIAGMLVVMFWLNWDFTLLVVAITPFLLLFVARFRRAIKKATREVRLRQSDVLAVVQAGLESIRAVQAFGGEAIETARLDTASRATVTAALRARRIKSLLSPVIGIVVAICTALILWRGSTLILAGAMTVGSLTVFLAYLTKFFKPVQDLAKMTNTIAQTNVGLERIRSILDIDPGVRERPDARKPKAFTGAIDFEHVAFSYSRDIPLIKDVHFSIARGQFVGIVGVTGSGKSTIAGLIPRFYDPTQGRILIDGADVRDYTLTGIRRQIGFVLQDTVIFPGTVHDNIAYGRPDATAKDVVNAATLANADEFIVKMALGYDTPLGERGSTLSGGQRQRDRHRARADPQRADPDSRRAHRRARHGSREGGHGRTGTSHEGTDGHHHHASARHAPHRRHDHRAERGRDRATGDARRAPGQGRPLRGFVRHQNAVRRISSGAAPTTCTRGAVSARLICRPA